MNDPLEIMELIEAGTNVHDVIHEDDWQTLRSAVESKAEELRQIKGALNEI